MPNKTLSITKAREDLFKIAEQVQKPNNFYTLSIEGEPKVVMMSYDEFDSMRETMEILSDPDIMKNIKKAEDEYEKGEYITWQEMKKELATTRRPALVLADKGKKKYSVRKKS
ncbi:MAG: Prevent-host-death family protein [Candidatus Amesbacteria bacterium GW2011_GWA2_42_12]|uniref:Antitoxin n=1 Tax=Candidatus Amesbacteria bacterium GW2011_GWA2_42_12 TaxID=1618356 RepID=A0A0G1ACP4_9BACT|nr:MAG: Prevent-host-death family protein [Candidatus Amesbacteria bacterium GW2011_GWA2_42_12]